jgi:peptide methionine sulfoxide reductase msrA/msrB
MQRLFYLAIALIFSFMTQAQDTSRYERALFASGCYWGTEYYMQQAEGVIDTRVGYAGGHVENPSYREVTTGRTGHAETVEVTYDPEKTDYETLTRLFFNTHDPTQVDRQGPDIGNQYRSAIFYLNEEQKQIAEKLIKELEAQGLDVATEVTGGATFYEEEKDYHHDYYQKTGGTPYCHAFEQKFE